MPSCNPYRSFNMRTRYEGLNYHVRNRAGVRKYGSGYVENTVQEQLASLKNNRTKIEKAIIDLNYDRKSKRMHHSIDFPSGNTHGCIELTSFTYLETIGKVSLANGVNKSMIANKNQATYDSNLIIDGGHWFGNRSQNSTDHIVDLITNGTITDPYYVVKNMKLYEAAQDALHFEYIENAFIHDIKVYNAARYGLYGGWLSDSQIWNCLPLDGGTNSLYYIGTSSKILDCYLNKGAFMTSVTRLTMTGCNFDVAQDMHGLNLNNAVVDSVFGNLMIFCQGDGATTYDAIRLAGGTPSVDNVFSNIVAKRKKGYEGTRQWNYAIEETDANQNYNTYGVINGRDTASGALRVLGPSSEVGHVKGTIVTT